MIDFLSDTVTQPTQQMREAMYKASVGDDVYGEDPTVNRLEAEAANRMGKAAACFMPSGTMANLTSILAHCARGYEVLVGDESDIYHYEAGGPSVVGGVVLHPVRTQPDGSLAIEDLRTSFRDPLDYQCARAGLICLENPHCRSGGRVLPLSYLQEVHALAKAKRIPVHMDGARIFNAALALDVSPAEIASFTDSLQFCLSKNLAAPIGSMVVGDTGFIDETRRLRKMLGGGMRQVGIIAAAGLVALNTMIDRLSEDHRRARLLAEAIAELPDIWVDLDEVQTNMVFFRLTGVRFTSETFLAELANHGVRMAELGHGRIRAVIHYQIDDSDIEATIDVFKKILK